MVRKVDIGPSEREELAKPHAGGDGEYIEGPEPIPHQGDIEWDERRLVERHFRAVVAALKELFDESALNQPHTRRLRNQADFYSLFGAVAQLRAEGKLPPAPDSAKRLSDFLRTVSDDDERDKNPDAKSYFQAARSASNDLRQRNVRITTLRKVLAGS